MAGQGAGRQGSGGADGFHWFQRRVLVGRGREDFSALADQILGLGLHRAAGVRVQCREPVGAVGTLSPGHVREGQELLLRYRWFPVAAPVRVLEATEPGPEAVCAGFVYEALPGHPEAGWESFEVVREEDGSVFCEIRALSRPVRWYSRLGGPVARAVQRRITRNYLEAAASGAMRGED